MGKNTKIEWADHTINLWWGCYKVSSGCKNCYAESLSKRFDNDIWGLDKPRKRIKSAFKELNKLQKNANKKGVKETVFVGSMMDVFETPFILNNPTEDYETTWDLSSKLFKQISLGMYDNLVFLFLTKRPENIIKQIPNSWITNPPKNIWFGTSISNQLEAQTQINKLNKDLKHYNLFISFEPQLDNITHVHLTYISWVIQGGESGKNRRPFDIQWAYTMQAICQRQLIHYFFKQIDKVIPIPSDLNIRQFPKF